MKNLQSVLDSHSQWLKNEKSGEQADMCGADLRGANLVGTNLSGADLFGADLSDAKLRGANLSEANLGGSNLSGSNLSEADLSDAKLRGADLSDAKLRGANLCGAKLCDADLSEANLCGANLSGADLGEADMCGANLSVANLSGADLREADLGEADMCGADLRGADLSEADMCGADLRGADMCGVKGVKAQKPRAKLYNGAWYATPDESDVLESSLRQFATPQEKFNFILRSCAERTNGEFMLRIRIMFTDGAQRMYFTGYHISGEPWVKLESRDAEFEFAERDVSEACRRSRCDMSRRPVKQAGFSFHWFFKSTVDQKDVPQYTPHSPDAELMDRVDYAEFGAYI